MSSIYERLYYEAVIDQLGDAAEILYVSVANAALAHLPYLIALDHASRCSPVYMVACCLSYNDKYYHH